MRLQAEYILQLHIRMDIRIIENLSLAVKDLIEFHGIFSILAQRFEAEAGGICVSQIIIECQRLCHAHVTGDIRIVLIDDAGHIRHRRRFRRGRHVRRLHDAQRGNRILSDVSGNGIYLPSHNSVAGRRHAEVSRAVHEEGAGTGEYIF